MSTPSRSWGLHGTGVDERRVSLDRAQVGEQIHLLAQRQDPLLRAHLHLRAVPLRARPPRRIARRRHCSQTSDVSSGSGVPDASMALPPMLPDDTSTPCPKREATDSSTLTASAVTSGPAPSPGSTATLRFMCPPALRPFLPRSAVGYYTPHCVAEAGHTPGRTTMAITTDAVIIGGGVMGASILYNLGRARGRIADPPGARHAGVRLHRPLLRRGAYALLHDRQRPPCVGEPSGLPELGRRRGSRRPEFRGDWLHGIRAARGHRRAGTQCRDPAGRRYRYADHLQGRGPRACASFPSR